MREGSDTKMLAESGSEYEKKVDEIFYMLNKNVKYILEPMHMRDLELRQETARQAIRNLTHEEVNRALDIYQERMKDECDRRVRNECIKAVTDLVVSTGGYDVDLAYSRHPFYVVEQPDVYKFLAQLKQDKDNKE